MMTIRIILDVTDTETALDKAEAAVIERVYAESRYNQSKAAKMLKLSRGALRYKLVNHFGDKYIQSNKKRKTA